MEDRLMAKKRPVKRIFDAEQAHTIVEAHDIRQCLDDEEESELLKENNPHLYYAYLALIELADSANPARPVE